VQIISKNVKTKDLGNVKEDERSHGIFVGYAPYNDPKFAIVTVVEHGVAGSRISSIPFEIFRYLLT
jgi:penicillin-binding protein 2